MVMGQEVMVLIKDGPRFQDAMRAIRSMAELHTPHDMTTAQMIEEFWQGFAPMFGCEAPRVAALSRLEGLAASALVEGSGRDLRRRA